MKARGRTPVVKRTVGLAVPIAAALLAGPPAWAQPAQVSSLPAAHSTTDLRTAGDVRRMTAELEQVQARQQAVEKLAHRLGLGCGLLAVLAAALAVSRWRGGTVTARRLAVRGPGRREAVVLSVSDRGDGMLELRGRMGRTTVLLSAQGDAPVLRLCDREGRNRASLSLGPDGSPLLELSDEQGRIRASLGLTEDGGAGLGLSDEQGQARAGLGLKEGGAGALSFMDEAGRCRLQAGMVTEDGPQLDLLGPDGQCRGSLRIRADGMALLELGDAEGRVRTLVGVLGEGTALVGLLDPERRFRAGLGVRQDGKPRLDLYDADGNTRATLNLEEDGAPGLSLTTASGSALFRAP